MITPSKLWNLMLLLFLVIVLVTWGLNQLGILDYLISAIAITLLTAGLFFAAGSKFQQIDSENAAKQQKRDEHERIARLMNDDMEDTTEYGQNMESSTNHARTNKPF